MLQIEERKQHQARLLDQLNSIQVPSINTPSPTFNNAPRMVSDKWAAAAWQFLMAC
jgi:hypothetical protein